MIDSLLLDIRYAVRSFRKAPLFASGVAATIGLGLGFLCSAFTVINGYLLKPFDVRDPHALFELSWDSTTERRHQFNIDEINALRADKGVFADVLAFGGFQLSRDETTVYGQFVTGNYFDTLGVQAFVGRLLQEDDARKPGERSAVVLSHHAWMARFGADPSIVGREVALGRRSYTVVGIVQPGFNGFGDAPITFWVPLTMAREFPAADPYAPEKPQVLLALARVRDGVPRETAAAWFDVWVKQRFADAPFEARPIASRFEPRATRIPLTGRTTSMFSAILAAFGLVLLIACANVANMMLARGIGRQREIAVRMSIGASRSRIVRQLLIESLMLAVPAALLGYGLTSATGRAIPALIVATWPEGLPPVQGLLAPMEPDVRVVSTLILAAVAAAVLFGLSPALQTTKTSLMQASRGEFGAGVRISHVRNALVVAQIAASALFLVTAAGLLGELRRLSSVETGLDISPVADLRVPREHRAAMIARLASDPRVESLAAAWRPPLYGPLRTVQVMPSGSTQEITAGFMVVSPGYFETLRVPVLRGRVFTQSEADAQGDVAIVSEATAARLWPNADPIGQTLDLANAVPGAAGLRRPPQTRVRVIGVAQDVTSGSVMDGRDTTCVYFPTGLTAAGELALLVRSRTDISAVRAAVSSATAAVRDDAAFQFYPMRQVVGLQIWALQGMSSTVTLLAAVALLLALSGTYGVVAFLVIQRTREFGIRLALGATAAGIVRGVVGQALRLGAIGTVAGGLLALALSQALASIIEIMPAFGPAPYVVGALVVLAATGTAASLPSLRASRVDAAAALRTE